MQDRDLVAAIVAGDPAGLAAAYDRYASALYAYCRTMLRDPEDAADALQDTFVVAAQKLDGLRDPDRLRPWLYAVARNECLRRVRGRQAQVTVDLDQAGEVSDDGVDVDAGLREADVRSLIWAAIQGLNPGEREVFELNVRHELDGADLAAALGVSANHAHALLSRARGQLEKSLGALLVARTGRQDCPDLAAILAGWDGELTALLRKRINRHIEQCEICAERKHRELRPEALLGALPILLLPPGLRSSVLHLVGSVLPGQGQGQGRSQSQSQSAQGGASSADAPSNSSSSNAAATADIPSTPNLANTANMAEYCAHVARRAEPFDRAGFPVPLDRRRRGPLAAALLLLLALLGLGGYAVYQRMSADSAAATLPTQSPSTVVVVVDTQSSVLIETSASSPSASPSPSASASPSLSPSPNIIVIKTSAKPSRSPSRSPSPSPPPPGVLAVTNPTSAPYDVYAAYNPTYQDYVGTFTLTAEGGSISGYTIIVPTPSANSASPTAGGHMDSGKSDVITVYISTRTVVFTVQPEGSQPAILVTAYPLD